MNYNGLFVVLLFTVVILNNLHGDVVGTTDDPDVAFLDADCSVLPGIYAVEVSNAGTRANVTSRVQQFDSLAMDEELTINGFQVFLTAGMNRQNVLSAINSAFPDTGARADLTSGFFTRIYSDGFGTSEEVVVQSNIAAASTSSGFGTGLLADQGSDIGGTIGGVTATGFGNILDGNGIRVLLSPDSSDVTDTVIGAQGNVTISSIPEPGSSLLGIVVVFFTLSRKDRKQIA